MNGHECIPDRVECVQRALNYLTQAETTLDTKNPTQNALVGIGYAILAQAEATNQLARDRWEMVDELK